MSNYRSCTMVRVKFRILLLMAFAIAGYAMEPVDSPLAPNPNLAIEYTPPYYDVRPPEDPPPPELAHPARKPDSE
jgi:hypothetical protein